MEIVDSFQLFRSTRNACCLGSYYSSSVSLLIDIFIREDTYLSLGSLWEWAWSVHGSKYTFLC